MSWPITYADANAARERVAEFLSPTPMRNYPALDRAVGNDIRVWVKHENHLPTNAFKARNAISAMTMLDADQRKRGVVAATRGNHGQGVAWAGALLGVPVTICVPVGNNPEKNQAMRDFGAEVIERGRDYDESVEVAMQLVAERGLVIVHSTNNPHIIAGASTITAEILDQVDDLDALVIAVGGGSQAVGALTIARERRPDLQIFGVQAANAAAIHDSWHAGERLSKDAADTFADGLATRHCYDLTFDALREGLSGFVAASESQIADAVRLLLETTHNLVEGAGAAGLTGLRLLADELAGKQVGVILSGGNIDQDTLRRIMNREL